jgi:hypothetical protein
MAAVLTFFLGFIQTLSLPRILVFSGSAIAGTLETICALGMLVSSLLADSIGQIIGTGSARATGFLIMIAGMLLCLTAVTIYNIG